MKPETKKYVRKLRQITAIICDMKVRYEDDDIVAFVSPDFRLAETCAEVILSKLGINKPQEPIH